LIVFLALSNFTDEIGRLIKTHYLLGDHVFHIYYGLDEMPLALKPDGDWQSS
jgi:hypothetical protein